MRLSGLVDTLSVCENRAEVLATLVHELDLGVVLGAAERHGWPEVRRAWRWWQRSQAERLPRRPAELLLSVSVDDYRAAYVAEVEEETWQRLPNSGAASWRFGPGHLRWGRPLVAYGRDHPKKGQSFQAQTRRHAERMALRLSFLRSELARVEQAAADSEREEEARAASRLWVQLVEGNEPVRGL